MHQSTADTVVYYQHRHTLLSPTITKKICLAFICPLVLPSSYAPEATEREKYPAFSVLC
jgi:hypothetical protein